MKKKRAKGLLKFLAICTAIIAFLLIAFYLLINHFGSQICEHAIKRLEKGSGGVYSITYDRMDFDSWRRSIEITNLCITPHPKLLDGTLPGSMKKEILVKTAIPIVKMEGISILSLLFNKTLRIGKLSLTDGDIAIFKSRKGRRIDDNKKRTAVSEGAKKAGRKPKRKAALLKSIHIKNLRLEKSSLNLFEDGKEEPILGIREFSLLLSRLKIYPKGKKRADKKMHISLKAGQASLKAPYIVLLPERLYQLGAKEIDVSTAASYISIAGFELLPLHEKYRFARARGYRTSRLHLKVGNVTFGGVDFKELIKNRSFYSKRLVIEKPELDIFRDNRVRKNPKPRRRKFPQQLLREFKYKVRIDQVKISPGTFIYTVHPERARRSLKIVLADFQANIENISNRFDPQKKQDFTVLNASAKLMGKADFRINLTMPVNNRMNLFRFSGSLERIDMKEFNPILRDFAYTRIERGLVNRLYFSARANSKRALGEMRLSYQNLKIARLRKGGQYKKNSFSSFLANTIIRKNNPRPGRSLRIGKIFYKREKPISFFNYIWKSLLSGIKSSIGLTKSKKRGGK